jgi:hypothetical protein
MPNGFPVWVESTPVFSSLAGGIAATPGKSTDIAVDRATSVLGAAGVTVCPLAESDKLREAAVA